MIKKLALVMMLAALLLGGCSRKQADDGRLKVVATTTIVADVVRQVGGDFVSVTTLLPVGADPHSFSPRPQDIAQVSDAAVVFANGAGLEEFLEPLLENAGGKAEVVHLSEGLTLLEAGAHEDEAEHAAGDGHDDEEGAHHHADGDPHTWTDPHNVIHWVDVVEQALARLDPAHAADYPSNAAAYREQLRALDAWIQAEVAKISSEQRQLVTDHTAYSYFAARYGFEQVGAIIPGYSTNAQPSAQEIAQLEELIRAYHTPAVFVGKAANATLAERIAEDTGVKLVYLYGGSLSDPSGEAGTYLDYMRYNVTAMVGALQGVGSKE